jgi:hypothetical protein
MIRPIRHTSGCRAALVFAALATLIAYSALAALPPAAGAATHHAATPGAATHRAATHRAAPHLPPGEAARGGGARASRGCVVKIVRDVFVPATVTEGGTTRLHIALHNCTSSAKPVRVQTDGRLVCLTLDPLVRSFTVPAGTTLALPRQTYLAPSCAGVATIYIDVENNAGHLLSSGQAHFTVTAPST